jgi:hypothetical protein
MASATGDGSAFLLARRHPRSSPASSSAARTRSWSAGHSTPRSPRRAFPTVAFRSRWWVRASPADSFRRLTTRRSASSLSGSSVSPALESGLPSSTQALTVRFPTSPRGTTAARGSLRARWPMLMPPPRLTVTVTLRMWPGDPLHGQYIGVAPNANLISVKFSDETGKATVLDVIYGLQFAVAHQSQFNIRMINLSLAPPPRSPTRPTRSMRRSRRRGCTGSLCGRGGGQPRHGFRRGPALPGERSVRDHGRWGGRERRRQPDR